MATTNGSSGKVIRIGSRDSRLAMIQSEDVVGQLQTIFPEHVFKIESMKTIGDKILDKALSKIGQTNLFTKELESALAEKHVELLVHSLKDVPTEMPPNMVLTGIPTRANPYDAVILHPKNQGRTLATLPVDSVVGTSSLRRVAQLSRAYPYLKFKSIRGNLNTRLKKLEEADDYAAIVLACAGLERMGWHDKIAEELTSDTCMYAVGQGALAVEVRADDFETIKLVSETNDPETVLRCIAERSFLNELQGGCSVPIGVFTEVRKVAESDVSLAVHGGVFSLDGTQYILKQMEVSLTTDCLDIQDFTLVGQHGDAAFCTYVGIVCPNVSVESCTIAESAGRDLAKMILNEGGKAILDKAKKDNEDSKDVEN